MSNYSGRKSDFIPTSYARYFERSETTTTTTQRDHVHFDDEPNVDQVEDSTIYQTKRDLLFKRLFPSKYADTNNNETTNESNTASTSTSTKNGTGNSGAQSLGDFIPLLSTERSSRRKDSSFVISQRDVSLSSSDDDNYDDDDDDIRIEHQIPSIKHPSVVGHLHSRLVIENVRAMIIRELYQRTSDPHTEWLKCKMEIPRDFVNPKYYADFQRRYRHEIKRNAMKNGRKSSNSKIQKRRSKSKSVETIDERAQDQDVIIVTDTQRQISTPSRETIKDSSKPTPEYILLDSELEFSDEETSHPESKNQSLNDTNTFFIDRTSISSLKKSDRRSSTSREDYIQEDSKYAQLPSRNNADSKVIRPVISKHQRRKKKSIPETENSTSMTPLVSAIDRIIDHLDNDHPRSNQYDPEEQNLVIKSLKKRNRKKKKKETSVINTTGAS